MYLWKYWRDTRVKVFIAFGVILVLIFFPFVLAIHGHSIDGPGKVQEMLQTAFLIPSGLLWFFGWILSKDNVGGDIGNSGDFLLTRPASRGRLVWTGWMAGMTEGVVLWIVLSAIMYGAMLFRMQQFGVSILSGPQGSVAPGLVLLFFSIFLLNLGLIYGLGYCIGVIASSGSWALIVSAIVIIGYGFLESFFRHQWNIHLPDFILPLRTHHNTFEFPSTLAFTVHACLFVAFPAVAHFVLERMDV